MNLFEDTNPRALKDLLSEVHNRTAVLPDFQRDFVWEPGATQELIVSIANNYPAGSILRVRDAKRVFAAREFEGAPLLGDAKHTFLVLDGQQRLTSLYQAFYGVGEHRYYLSIGKLIEGDDFEDAIFHVRATTKWAKAREDFEIQAKELLLPLSVLKGGSGGFGKWSRNVARQLDDKKRIALEDALEGIEEKWIHTIDDYHFPVVTLSDKTEPDALCTIFETLNRTGVKLSVFELLTARFWPQNIKLRDLWDKALADYPIIEDFEVDPYYVLQGISLACRKAPSCKRSDVLNMKAFEITEWWDKVVVGLAAGLEILREDCKVMLPKWLPYQTMLPPLAAVMAKAGNPKTAEAGAQREKIKRWFWCAVFGQIYESSPNSKSAKDVVEIIQWFKDESLPESVDTFRFDPRALRDVTPRQRSIYRGAICLILRGGARDFHTQAVITGKIMAQEGIDDHHVFPAAYLERNGVTLSRNRDCILNRTLIDRTTNQMISDRAPSDYLAEIRKTSGFPYDSVLTSHILPVGGGSPLLTDDYETYLIWRQDRLWQEIQNVTGVKKATDLEADLNGDVTE
ncbi:MAG: GmrSD restriction endonuclease domain-containing protein [Desulfobulbia bacterium]